MQGELAHLVDRLHGMQEVTGSIPVFSTKKEADSASFFYDFCAFVTDALFSAGFLSLK